MLQFTKDLLKEILIILVMTQVAWFLIPNFLKKMILKTTKVLGGALKGIARQVKYPVFYHLDKKKKVTSKAKKQLDNIITVKFPNQKTKKYNKAK